MAEKRLIDADELEQFIADNYGYPAVDILHEISTFPTVDAVEVPCKMGDKVWGIRKYNHGGLFAKQGKVYQMFFGHDMQLCICVKGVCRGEWGKNIFATKEDVEAAIASIEGERKDNES